MFSACRVEVETKQSLLEGEMDGIYSLAFRVAVDWV
jgi:hypothetical protein